MSNIINTNPSILWAQDRNYIFITLEIENIREQNIEFEINKINFKGSSIDDEYNIIIELFGEIDIDKCNWNIKQNCVKFIIKKVRSMFWNRLTLQKQNNVKIDWSKWVIEDDSDSDSEEENEMVSNFNDFKKNIPSEILEKDFKELFSPDEEISDENNSSDNTSSDDSINGDSPNDASGELSSSLVEDLNDIELDMGEEGLIKENLNQMELKTEELDLDDFEITN